MGSLYVSHGKRVRVVHTLWILKRLCSDKWDNLRCASKIAAAMIGGDSSCRYVLTAWANLPGFQSEGIFSMYFAGFTWMRSVRCLYPRIHEPFNQYALSKST